MVLVIVAYVALVIFRTVSEKLCWFVGLLSVGLFRLPGTT